MSVAVVVMGVTGCGKSTLGAALAGALGWRFVEGDTLHPAANIAKMSRGMPLDDSDRTPFLNAVVNTIRDGRGAGIVVACSALKRSYRDLIRGAGEVRFVLPLLERPQLLERLRERRGHFMPVELLDSQLATLELPAPGEPVLVLDGSRPQEEQLAAALAYARAGS